MAITGAQHDASAAKEASSAGEIPTRWVEPKATSVAWDSGVEDSSWKSAVSLGLEPGQPASM